ncbi:hypothetical protein N431DRAFT_475694 [Stipitochalara longipes BDJ]|nr:hypothetical protein N431DRAFT_475694 [Stipitochalara longipes BDJ]
MGEVSFGSGGQQHVLDGFQVPDQDSDFFEHEENTGTLSISEHTSSWPKLTFDPCEFHLTDPKFPCINLGDFNMSSQPTFNALSSTSPSGAGCVSHSPGPDESRLSTASLYSSPNSGMEQTLVPSDLPDTQRSQRFYCLVSGCTKNYKRKHELKRHQKHHSGVKLYQCTVSGCNRSGQNGFVRKDHLGQHMKKVHSRESSL